MELEFSGAAREVTGSCHVVRHAGKTILLDCGLFQGRRAAARAKNERLPLPVGEIDAIVLSHAHIDHAGRLPFLVAAGYQGPIWTTSATRDLSALMLADSAHIQEKDAEFLTRRGEEAALPLYRMADAVRTVELMIGVNYQRPADIFPGTRVTFTDAGHILGSASVVLDCGSGATGRRLVFSGDVGRSGLAIIGDPEPPAGADFVIMESTYGNRDHEPIGDARAHLGRVVKETAARGGKLLIPAFAVGRTQELVYDLHVLARAGQIPAVPIFVDSPLATDTTGVFAAHPELWDRTEEPVRRIQQLFSFDLLKFTREVEESKGLNTMRGPAVIIAASGMCESGRILHHLANHANDPRTTILIAGFQAEHTLGRRIVDRVPELKVFGRAVPLRAHVEILNGYSAHGDRTELRRWLSAVRASSPRLQGVALVHGEPAAQDAFAAAIVGDGYRVTVPATGDRLAVP
ncbi:MAG: MBL fold metallo-hydrolase [Gemmatimonadetes bacterium]|nr:MBL fold metallo-hydrolase [Gemmatimonadota bacterium]